MICKRDNITTSIIAHKGLAKDCCTYAGDISTVFFVKKNLGKHSKLSESKNENVVLLTNVSISSGELRNHFLRKTSEINRNKDWEKLLWDYSSTELLTKVKMQINSQGRHYVSELRHRYYTFIDIKNKRNSGHD